MTRHLEIEYSGQTIGFDIDVSQINQLRVKRILSPKFAKAMCAVLTNWDITQDGEMLPITPQTVWDLPFDLVTSMYNKILQCPVKFTDMTCAEIARDEQTLHEWPDEIES